MYTRGMSTREIAGHLRELYGIEVSPDLVSVVTDAVLDEVAEWQNRPLEALYPLVFLDALRVKERGVEDVPIAVVDGLKGFPDAIAAVFPRTQVQACIVHLIRSSLDLVSYKDRRAVAVALKEIYRARDAEAGRAALEAFADGPWGRKYPAIPASWRRHWGEVIPFYAFPAEVRRIVYTTNAIEALHAKLRRAVRARGHFPHDDAVLKLLFLVLNLAAKEWRMPAREWTAAKAQFAILFEDRFAIT
jgi:putative transposase